MLLIPIKCDPEWDPYFAVSIALTTVSYAQEGYSVQYLCKQGFDLMMISLHHTNLFFRKMLCFRYILKVGVMPDVFNPSTQKAKYEDSVSLCESSLVYIKKLQANQSHIVNRLSQSCVCV